MASAQPAMTWARFSRLVALGVAAMALTGCSRTPMHFVLPELPDRASRIDRIAVLSVGVSVRREGIYDFPPEWSEAARTNLSQAIAKSFGRDPRFAITELDPKEAPAARQELARTRDLMAKIRPRRIEARDCLAGPAPELVSAAGTDTLLLVYAKDSIASVKDRLVHLAATAMVMPVILYGAVVYGPEVFRDNPDRRVGDMKAIVLCLVDASQGDILWFDLRFLNGGSLLDASDVERRIGDAYADFRQATHP